VTVSEVEPQSADHSSSAAASSGSGRPRLLWWVVALQALLMVGMTVLYPAFQNADEPAHVDYVLAHRQGQWLDGPGERQYQSGVLKAAGMVPNTQFRTHIASPPVQRSARKSFDELGTASVQSPITNQMVQHPPLYYGLAAGFSFLIPHFDRLSFDWQVFWLRVFSVLLLLPVPVLIFSAARRLTGNVNLALLAAIIPMSFPAYLRTGGSVTNDSLLILATTALIAMLTRVSLGDLTRRTAVVVGVLWTAGLLTKGFAMAMPPVIVLAYLVGARGSLGERIRRAWQPVVIAGAVGTIAGGWWWVRNVVVDGALQPSGLGPIDDATRQLITGSDRPGGTDLEFFGNFFRLLGQRTWGSLGLLDIPSLAHPFLQVMAVVFLLILVVGVGIGARPVRRLRGAGDLSFLREWTVGRAVTLLFPAVLTMLVMYAGSRSVYLHGRQLPGIQIRYLFPTVLGPAVVAAVGLAWLVGRRARPWLVPSYLLLSLVFLVASVQQVLNIEMSSRKSTSYLARINDGLHFVVGWAPWSAAGTAALGLLTVLVASLTLLGATARAVRLAQRERPR
jgi:small subunit ribosomal protein S36